MRRSAASIETSLPLISADFPYLPLRDDAVIGLSIGVIIASELLRLLANKFSRNDGKR